MLVCFVAVYMCFQSGGGGCTVNNNKSRLKNIYKGGSLFFTCFMVWFVIFKRKLSLIVSDIVFDVS